MLLPANATPVVLIFDLDETLFYTSFEGRRNPLSESAIKALSSSEVGQAHEFKLHRSFSANVKAIARQEIKKIFDLAYEIIKKYGQHAPIAIKVMTAAQYEEQNIKLLFDRFYGDADQRFSTNQFPIEYYNAENLDSQLPVIPHHLARAGVIDPCKAFLIQELFPAWQKAMPGLKMKNVFLIDNADFNTLAVEQLGFSVIHYPTTPSSRPVGESYSQASASILKRLRALVTSSSKEAS